MKKKLLSILLVATMLLAMIPAVTFATSAATTVTDWDAEEIVLMNADDFRTFRKQIKTKGGNAFVGQTVKLGADINLNNVNLASDAVLGSGNGFCGTFDGQNHTIYNIYFNKTDTSYEGLFGAIGRHKTTTAVLKNFAMVGAKIQSNIRTSMLYSAVYSDLEVENVYINGTVISNNRDASGGFIGYTGYCTVSIKNCVFDGTVTNTSANGAFIGKILVEDADTNDSFVVTLENCLTNSTSATIGVIASAKQPTLTNCITYDAATVGEGLAAQTYLDANGYTEWTALQSGYPVPTAIASVYFDARMIDWTDDEIVLSSAEAFIAFRQKIQADSDSTFFVDKIVKLGADIDMCGYNMTTANLYAIDSSRGFYGTFDGQGHAIKNLNFNIGNGYQGLFGNLHTSTREDGATLKNFAIINASFAANTRASMLYAAVYSDLTIENVYVNATVKSNNQDASGGFIGQTKYATVSFKNCVFEGTVTNTLANGAFIGKVLAETSGADDSSVVTLENCLTNSTSATIGVIESAKQPTLTNCITYDAATVGEGFGAQEYLNENGLDGFTARNTSYPVPTTLLPFYASEINSARTLDGTTEYYAYQTTDAKDSVRFAGVVTGDATAIKAVGFEVVAIRENGNTWTNVVDGEAPIIQNVYTSILEAGTPKTAAECGGDYLFVYAVNDMVANKGVVTFAVKTFTVNTEGVKTYNDMCIVAYDTTLAA